MVKPRYSGSFFAAALCLVFSLWMSEVRGAAGFITLASTTSADNSGFLGYVLPQFSKATGVKVRVIAVGTGQAVRLAMRGDADVLMVHHKQMEDKFVADGFGIKRRPLMYNDFVIVGPASDPAGIGQLSRPDKAFQQIASKQSAFVSRGDNSGTHRAEIFLWQLAGRPPNGKTDRWYREIGSGMGATLNIAFALDAYTLVDRATWSSFQSRSSHKILLQGDPKLRNEYSIILVNPARHPHTKFKAAKIFENWLFSAPGQKAIASFTIGGKQQFHLIKID